MNRSDKKEALRAWRRHQREEAAVAEAQLVRHDRWYFIVHLSPEDQAQEGGQFEVQFLDDRGRGAEYETYSSPTETIILGGSAVPQAVLAAASRLPAGQGCYVDTDGWELTPLGARVSPEKARVTGGRTSGR